jgi:hypothetical protein
MKKEKVKKSKEIPQYVIDSVIDYVKRCEEHDMFELSNPKKTLHR